MERWRESRRRIERERKKEREKDTERERVTYIDTFTEYFSMEAAPEKL
jgi:hypothetical protein